MKITKAIITAAAPSQRTLPLQTLVDRDGEQKSVLSIILGEAHGAGIQDVCVVIHPGDESAYRQAAGSEAGGVRFVTQNEPRGYGHAIYCAREFAAGEPFLHMVGDHVYVSGELCCARQIVNAAETQACAVSGVQATRENQLPYFGAVGGRRIAGTQNLYQIERVVEKPTPTQAEQSLAVPGLRAGSYLCFFGLHVLSPTVLEILHDRLAADAQRAVGLSATLNELAGRERYLAFEAEGRRYAVDARYGLLTAQLALALSGQDRDEVLTGLCELLAQREIQAPIGGTR